MYFWNIFYDILSIVKIWFDITFFNNVRNTVIYDMQIQLFYLFKKGKK